MKSERWYKNYDKKYDPLPHKTPTEKRQAHDQATAFANEQEKLKK